jgi:tetratricopeptide (TPR) repeat protein
MKLNLFIAVFILSLATFGQKKVSSKLYAKELKEADFAFESEDYLNAINLYRKVLAIDPEKETANLNSLIARLKLSQIPDSCYNHISKLKNSSLPEVSFYFGKIYHLSSNFNEAINCYTKYKNIPEKYRKITNVEVDYYINCSNNAKQFTTNPHRSIIKNIGSVINTTYGEYVPLITPDESCMYFTSRREGSVGNLKDPYGSYYEDVYKSVKD